MLNQLLLQMSYLLHQFHNFHIFCLYFFLQTLWRKLLLLLLLLRLRSFAHSLFCNCCFFVSTFLWVLGFLLGKLLLGGWWWLYRFWTRSRFSCYNDSRNLGLLFLCSWGNIFSLNLLRWCSPLRACSALPTLLWFSFWTLCLNVNINRSTKWIELICWRWRTLVGQNYRFWLICLTISSSMQVFWA